MNTSVAGYRIELPAFAGPLDLLLHLIERDELDITAISLLAVTDQYLQQIASIQEDRVEQLGDFLVIAARLLAIKSRALLPANPALATDEEPEEDPAEALARQLRVYKQFKEAADWLAKREDEGLRTFLRVAPPPRVETRLDLTGLTVQSLAEALLGAVARMDAKEDSVSVAVERQAVTIDRQISRVRELGAVSRRFLFSDILSARSSWSEVSVTLLAILELVKRHEVRVSQRVLFGPIEIVVTRPKSELPLVERAAPG